MKFFIDTANLDQIKEAQDLGVLDGVTTNPSLMAKEGITGGIHRESKNSYENQGNKHTQQHRNEDSGIHFSLCWMSRHRHSLLKLEVNKLITGVTNEQTYRLYQDQYAKEQNRFLSKFLATLQDVFIHDVRNQ